MNLKEFQDRFQRAILAGDDTILSDIPDGPHETKQKLLGIYRDAYALRLWRQVETAAKGPWFLGERFSALDIYLSVMTRWRPKRGWFETETHKLFAIARRADLKPELTEVWKRNWPT